MLEQKTVIEVLRKQAKVLRKQASEIEKISTDGATELHKVATKLDGKHVHNFLNFYGRLAN